MNGSPVRVDLVLQTGLEVVPRAVVERQPGSQPPLVLSKEPVIPVREGKVIALLQFGGERVRPRLHVQRMRIVQGELAIHIVGSSQRDPVKRGSDAVEQGRGEGTGRAGHLGERRPALDVHEVGKVHKTIEVGHDDPRGREAGIVRGVRKDI